MIGRRAGALLRPVETVTVTSSRSIVVMDGPGPGAIGMFGKLGPRICKLLGGQGVQAKAALLGVMGSLAQVGAISSQNMQQTLQSIRDCLENSDWATRKAAADTLCVFATHSGHLIGDGTAPTIAALEACRFDTVRPVRDSMIDAVQLWKKLTGEDANDGRNKHLADGEGKLDSRSSTQRGGKSESFDDSSPDSPSNNVKGSSIAEKAAVLLKKRPTLTDRELNPEFFQKLETRKTDDLAVEVVVPRKTLQSHLRSEGDTEEDDPVGPADSNGSAEDEAYLTQMCASSNFQNIRDKWGGQRGNRNKDTKARTADVEDRGEPSTKDSTAATMNIPGEGPFINNKTNWLAIQRQLTHLERQQTSLMNMLQLTDLVMENGSDYLGIPLDAKRDLLLGLHEATAIELPDDWEGATPMQIMKQLASSWRIDLQQLIN